MANPNPISRIKRDRPCPLQPLHLTFNTCRYCRQKAGILTQNHPECRRPFSAGWNRKVELAADAARTHNFDETSLRLSLADIAGNSYGDGATATVNEALEEG